MVIEANAPSSEREEYLNIYETLNEENNRDILQSKDNKLFAEEIKEIVKNNISIFSDEEIEFFELLYEEYEGDGDLEENNLFYLMGFESSDKRDKRKFKKIRNSFSQKVKEILNKNENSNSRFSNT